MALMSPASFGHSVGRYSLRGLVDSLQMDKNMTNTERRHEQQGSPQQLSSRKVSLYNHFCKNPLRSTRQLL